MPITTTAMISQLTASGIITGNELIELVQSGTSSRAIISNLLVGTASLVPSASFASFASFVNNTPVTSTSASFASSSLSSSYSLNALTAYSTSFTPNTALFSTQSIFSTQSLFNTQSIFTTRSLFNTQSLFTTQSVFNTQSLFSTQSTYSTQSINATNSIQAISTSFASASTVAYSTSFTPNTALFSTQSVYITKSLFSTQSLNTTQSSFATQSLNTTQSTQANSASWVSASLTVLNGYTASYVTCSNSIITNGYAEGTNWQSIITASSYTTVATDDGKMLIINSGSNVTVTLATASISPTFTCTFFQSGSGNIVFLATGVVTRNRNGLSGSSGQYSICTVTRLPSGNYLLIGDLQ